MRFSWSKLKYPSYAILSANRFTASTFIRVSKFKNINYTLSFHQIYNLLKVLGQNLLSIRYYTCLCGNNFTPHWKQYWKDNHHTSKSGLEEQTKLCKQQFESSTPTQIGFLFFSIFSVTKNMLLIISSLTEFNKRKIIYFPRIIIIFQIFSQLQQSRIYFFNDFECTK